MTYVLVGVVLGVLAQRVWRRWRRRRVRVDGLDRAQLQRVVERHAKDHVGEE